MSRIFRNGIQEAVSLPDRLSARFAYWPMGNSLCVPEPRNGDMVNPFRSGGNWCSFIECPYSSRAPHPGGRARCSQERRGISMVAFLRWVRSIVVGTLNGVAMFALFLVLMFVALFAVGLAVGDGMPDKILLTLDLR